MHIGGRTELLEYHQWPCKIAIPAKFAPTLDISPPSTTMGLVEQWWTPSTEDNHEAVIADVRPIWSSYFAGFSGATCKLSSSPHSLQFSWTDQTFNQATPVTRNETLSSMKHLQLLWSSLDPHLSFNTLDPILRMSTFSPQNPPSTSSPRPSQIKFIRPAQMALFAKIISHPPLAQVTVIPSNRKEVSLFLEILVATVITLHHRSWKTDELAGLRPWRGLSIWCWHVIDQFYSDNWVESVISRPTMGGIDMVRPFRIL